MDSGDLLWKSSFLASNEVEQRKLKATLLFEAMGALQLDALTPGEGDLIFGLEFLIEGVRKHRLPYVSANLRRADDSALFPAFVVVERAGLRIGITGVTAPALLGEDIKTASLKDSLSEVIGQLRGREAVDLVVLLSHQGTEADNALVRAVPGIDLLFSAHDRRFQVDPRVIGNTALFQAGSRGKYLGQVELELVEGRSGWAAEAGRAKAQRRQASLQRQLTRYRGQLDGDGDDRSKARISGALQRVEQQLADLEIPPADDGTHNRATGQKVPMSRDVADDPAMKKIVDATLESLGETVAVGHIGHGSGKTSRSPKKSGPYVGAGVCMGCHAGQYGDWAGTPHATAWRTLVAEKRHFDQDCWSCHVTGANKPGGPRHPKDVGSMRNVQCEACHGPGEKHIAAPSQVDMLRSPSEELCITCHTMEQTEGRFVFEDYIGKVDHRP